MHEIYAMRQNDEKQIREKLKEIDDILTRECLFCGSMLIDMIDNDIEVKVQDMFAEFEDGDEFGGGDDQDENTIDDMLNTQKNMDWAIE